MVRGVLWDVGNVIIRRDPRLLYSKIFDDPVERDWFLEHVCNDAWNTEFDRGRPFAEGIADLTSQFPQYAGPIAAWRIRTLEMLEGPIEETEAAMDALAAKYVPQYALTNMEVELWPQIQTLSPAFRHLKGAIVSGAEKLIKPYPAIFRLALARFGMAAADLLFIDDNLANVETAKTLGFDTHHFTDPAAVVPALEARGLL